MSLHKPQKTLADYMVISISPVLIMLVVGSLGFFLVEVFYRGDMVLGVRWVMFWFVLAIVLVSRIGIERSPAHAMGYGLALAMATWFYLMMTQPGYFLGVILLGVVWWCANKLTWDCTLIDDDQDASDVGLLQAARQPKGEVKKDAAADKKRNASEPSRAATERKKRTAPAQRPGLWVVYFSLGALPLFGIGQTLLPGDSSSRSIGLVYLLVYLAAALGLLLTTGFLGLRRYLRQRYLRMPATIAFGWIRFGVGVALAVLVAALLLPRPGAYYTWKSLGYRIDYTLRKASDYAARSNPHGKGQGRASKDVKESGDQSGSGAKAEPDAKDGQAANSSQSRNPPRGENHGGQNNGGQKSPSPSASLEQSDRFYALFKTLFFLTVALLFGCWAFRRRHLIMQLLRLMAAAISQFLGSLFGFGNFLRPAKGAEMKSKQIKHATYKNPFMTGADKVWPPERLILYSFDAIQSWAKEQGVVPQPQQTAREFCFDLGEKFPEVADGLNRLSFLYGHAAYGIRLPEHCEVESLRPLWRYVSDSQSFSVLTADEPG